LTSPFSDFKRLEAYFCGTLMPNCAEQLTTLGTKVDGFFVTEVTGIQHSAFSRGESAIS
jgi:hypothetical protein